MTDRIVIITGGRELKDPAPVWAFLDEQYAIAKRHMTWMVVYHGACPTGADNLALRWVQEQQRTPGFSTTERSFVPDPRLPSPARFHARNRDMVSTAAKRRDDVDCTLIAGAFPGEGNGTRNTIKLLAKAKIETRVVEGCR